jgi:SAM-dependent methyltransferase
MKAVLTPISPRAADAHAALPLRMPIRGDEPRSEAQLREHYLIERELADRLRDAEPQARRGLYPQVYDELFRRVPHHPQNRPGDGRARGVEQDLQFLRRFLKPGTVFMEIGAGDCALSCRVAGIASRVYAVDVSEQIMRSAKLPANVERVLSDGCSIPVPEGTVDLAFSDQLMEHLHPDDAAEQLRNIYRCLAPGGVYICITPNRLYGPRDVSAYFDEVATGFHLREYTGQELRGIFGAAGFSRVRVYAGARGWFVPAPSWLTAAAEGALGALPYRLRKPLADNGPVRALLGLRVTAHKDAG